MATEYTFQQLKIEVAENIGYDTGANGILSTKDVTESMIEKFINRRYYELLAPLMEKYPEDYIRVSYADFWKEDSTVSSITDDTLVAAGSIFNNGMVGDTIYNSTKEESAVIASYTNGTTVVLASEPDWDAADVIYVLGHEFALGGNAADARYVKKVAVKYSTSDQYYKSCEWIGVDRVYQRGDEVYNVYAPQTYKTNLKVSGAFVPAIGIVPEPTVPITRGIQLTYLEVPKRMDTNTDVPELPLASQHALVDGATVNALRKLRRYDEVAPYLADWQQGKAEVAAFYARSRVQNQSGKRDNNYLLRIRAK